MKSFVFALKGLTTAFNSEWNLKFHLVAAIAVMGLGWWVRLTHFEWLVIVLSIGLVITSELLNTAIEYLVDVTSPGYNPSAGKVKDIAAGAVLVASITAMITGAIIFLPKIF